MASSLTYRRFRAPAGDGGLLIDPGWSASVAATLENTHRLGQIDFDLLGSSFRSVRQQTREECLQRALEYTRGYCVADTAQPSSVRPLICSGHQPQLFHPGVWAKAFAADWLARQVGGQAVHLIVDSDLCREHALRIPTGDVTRPLVVSEPYDQYEAPVAYELRRVRDLPLFKSFGQRVAQQVASLVPNPLIRDLWPDAVEAAEDHRPLGLAFAEARHRRERRWGLQTLEVPLSVLTETDGFGRFLLVMLLQAELVRESHNRNLQEYRRLHRLRNAAQPVPDLRQSEGWTETPFWIWTRQDPGRRALWSRMEGTDLVLSDLRSLTTVLPAVRQDIDKTLRRLVELRGQGICIRPRALSNTLFARLLLGDIFLHGIGGSKYDQVTDLWMADLFPVDPPAYVTISLTLHLPVPHASISPMAAVAAKQRLREMHFHPERFISPEDFSKNQVSPWAEAKSRWIREVPPRGQRRERHEGISLANAKLGEFLQDKRRKKEAELAEMGRQLAACRVLESREWAFCLFPEDFLRQRLLELGGTSR